MNIICPANASGSTIQVAKNILDIESISKTKILTAKVVLNKTLTSVTQGIIGENSEKVYNIKL